MNERTFAGYCVNCNDQGYLLDLDEWNKEVGLEMAKEEGIDMTDKHWEVIDWLRDQCKQEVALSVRKVGKSGVVDIKGFYQFSQKALLSWQVK